MEENKKWSQDLYQKAIWFAGEAHGNQKIPGTDLPYVIHLSNVCMEVFAAICAHETVNPDLAIQCALLHDTIEDAGISIEKIHDFFGNEVAQGVLALTKNKNLAKSLRIKDSIERIKLQPLEIWMVKLADRITNLQPPPAHWKSEKIDNYRNEAAYILEHLGTASLILKERLENKIKNYPWTESSPDSKGLLFCM
jgi:(p)ppGpp synthase/HD superfamily hydrolase